MPTEEIIRPWSSRCSITTPNQHCRQTVVILGQSACRGSHTPHAQGAHAPGICKKKFKAILGVYKLAEIPHIAKKQKQNWNSNLTYASRLWSGLHVRLQLVAGSPIFRYPGRQSASEAISSFSQASLRAALRENQPPQALLQLPPQITNTR